MLRLTGNVRTWFNHQIPKHDKRLGLRIMSDLYYDIAP
jgi:hypothetical protein